MFPPGGDDNAGESFFRDFIGEEVVAVDDLAHSVEPLSLAAVNRLNRDIAEGIAAVYVYGEV